MSDATGQLSGLHLILGDEELLVERAVAAVLRQARAAAGTQDVPVDRLRAGEVNVSELAELLSPSLFADERVVVLESAAEAGKEAVAVIESAAADLPEGTVLVVAPMSNVYAAAVFVKMQLTNLMTRGEVNATPLLTRDTGVADPTDANEQFSKRACCTLSSSCTTLPPTVPAAGPLNAQSRAVTRGTEKLTP